MISLSDQEDTKDYVLETCISSLEMDVHDIRLTAKKFGFSVDNFGDDDEAADHYFVALNSGTESTESTAQIAGRLTAWLSTFTSIPWAGNWSLVINQIDDTHRFKVRLCKGPYEKWHVRGLSRADVRRLPWAFEPV